MVRLRVKVRVRDIESKVESRGRFQISRTRGSNRFQTASPLPPLLKRDRRA